MSTLIDFTPTTNSVFPFSPTITNAAGVGVQYNALVPYNMFGQRYYLNLTDLSGNQVAYVPVVGTGPQLTASFTWDEQTGIALATTLGNHNMPLAGLANARVANTGSSFDGDFQVLSTGPTSLTYGLLTDPAVPLPASGQLNFDINLLAGLGIGLILFHADTMQFEVF
jgi:hypothetical protein